MTRNDYRHHSAWNDRNEAKMRWMTSEWWNETVAQTAKFSSHSTHFDVIRLILASSNSSVQWGWLINDPKMRSSSGPKLTTFPLYLPHHSLQEQFFGYCSRLTPVCLSARGPVYIHPICLIPTFAPNRYYPPRHCNFNWNQSPSSPHWFPTTVNFDQSAPSQIPLPIPFA